MATTNPQSGISQAMAHSCRTTVVLLLCWLAYLQPARLAAEPTAANGTPIGHPIQLSDQVAMNDRYMQVRLRGALRLSAVAGIEELSALAWDADEQLLYALSDNGYLLHLHPVLVDDHLADLLLLSMVPLRDSRGRELSGHSRDSEGLALEHASNGLPGDSRLLISFERRNRIGRYDADGYWHGYVPLPEPLNKAEFYNSFNQGLEALTIHPELGLLTAPEQFSDRQPIPLFDLVGHSWLYQPIERNGALVALEALPTGDVIAMERAFTSPLVPWVITLSRINPTRSNSGQILVNEILLRFDSGEGWRTLNFEGLTAHRDGRFFIVSDDGGNAWQSTQLIYFELID